VLLTLFDDAAVSRAKSTLQRAILRIGGRKTSGAGREYLSVKLDDPSFPAPIFASLVAVEGGDGYALIWSRRSTD
jgi:uncharacterized protein (DUF736 family)